MEEQVVQDPGRADYDPPKGKDKKYAQRFEVKQRVWMKVATRDAPGLPDIVVYVKQAEDEGEKGWVYKVQEKDKEGMWYGRERWKREKALRRA